MPFVLFCVCLFFLGWIRRYLTLSYVVVFPSNCKLIFVDFSTLLWILCNQSKNIIYSLSSLVDLEMPHQCAQLIFLLGVTTYGTGLV